jgi:hypothetical protein
MEIVGWITIILLCALALIFIILELGPVISTEISSWKLRKQKALEAKEDKARFKSEMKELKRKAKKLNYMKKKGLDTSELELGLQPLCLYENNTDVEEVETQEDVIDIRTRYANKERKKDVQKMYEHKIGASGFKKI